MRIRPENESLHRAWIAGCLFAGVLFLTGGVGWLFDAGFSRGTLIGYGLAGVVALVFSRGLYHRSLVSGGLLLLMALGPLVQETVRWTMGGPDPGLSVAVFMRAGVALSGLGLSLAVIHGMYGSLRAEASSASHSARPS